MNASEREKIEIILLLEAIFQRYGYDFRHYARASIRRRIRHFQAKSGCARISEMIPRLLYDESFFVDMVKDFSITVTEMFRDPEFYVSLRQQVVPYLRTYPFFRVWHAGCATGEEVYSIAVLLQEEGIYERATLFATDFNDKALATAREGIYPLAAVREYTRNYQRAGGLHSFSGYYQAHYDSAIMGKELKKNITFANHNLVTDWVFGEMNMIVCRNVLIYFDRSLQDRVLEMFTESLAPTGFLCLGTKESLRFSGVASQYKEIDSRMKIFQKRG